MGDDNEKLSLKLKTAMTLADARDFHESACEMMKHETADKIWIEAVENEAIELPILQILACVVTKAKQNNTKVMWDNPSIALFEKSVEVGMDTALGL